MKLRRKKILNETVELNITAFLNLMVILVPFLLITAVFSRMTVLELTLPPLNTEHNQNSKIDLQLQFVIYPDTVILRDATLGALKTFEVKDGVINWTSVGKVLLELKTRFPEEVDIALLLDKSVPYSRLIEVMDHVGSIELVNITEVEVYELFPAISIGEAPAMNQSENTASTEGTVSTEGVTLDELQQKIQPEIESEEVINE